MASPDTMILLIVDYRAATEGGGGEDPCAPTRLAGASLRVVAQKVRQKKINGVTLQEYYYTPNTFLTPSQFLILHASTIKFTHVHLLTTCTNHPLYLATAGASDSTLMLVVVVL